MHGAPVDLGAMLLVGTVSIMLHLFVFRSIYRVYPNLSIPICLSVLIYSDRGDAGRLRRPMSDATRGKNGRIHISTSAYLSIYLSVLFNRIGGDARCTR